MDTVRAILPQINMPNRALCNKVSQQPHLHLLRPDRNMRAGRKRREDMRRKLMTSEQAPTLLWVVNLKLGEHFNHQLQRLADMPLNKKRSQDTERRNTEVK
jgi:hypothetical protein